MNKIIYLQENIEFGQNIDFIFAALILPQLQSYHVYKITIFKLFRNFPNVYRGISTNLINFVGFLQNSYHWICIFL